MRHFTCAALTAALALTLHAQNFTTVLSTGSSPISVGVNPVTNKIYVANGGSGTVTVVDGSTNSTSTVSAGAGPQSVAVNPVTNKIYVANLKSSNVTVIDGATASTVTIPTGASPKFVAVNPITNKIYVANSGANSVTIIDGSTNTTSTIIVGNSPSAIAVNPTTNQIYVANSGSNNVTVINGSTLSTATIAVGSYPISLTVNVDTNLIYVANFSSANLSVINGANNTAASVPTGRGPIWAAVNPANNKVFVANYFDNTMTVLNGTTNATTTVNVGVDPVALAIDTSTDIVYVANSGTTSLTAYNDATTVSTTLLAGAAPISIAANPVTHKIYASNYNSATLTVVDGSTYGLTSLTIGGTIVGFAVNAVTNKTYVANQNSSSVNVIDGATNSITTISLPSDPTNIAVNQVTNKIYVSCGIYLVVIDGASNTTTSVPVPGSGNLVVNEVTNKIYTVSGNEVGGNYITVLDGASNSTLLIYAGYSATAALFYQGGQLYPVYIALNPVTNKIYVGMEQVAPGYQVTPVICIDGLTNTMTTVGLFYNPNNIIVNPVTNKIYINDTPGLQVLDGATNVLTQTTVTGYALAINTVTNKLYVGKTGGFTVLDGVTNQTTPVALTLADSSVLLVDPATNKLYIGSSAFSKGDYVVDGLTNTATNLPIGNGIDALALNPLTGKVYAGSTNGTVAIISETQAQPLAPLTSIAPLTNNETASATPTLNLSVTEANQFGTSLSIPDQSLFQVDTQQASWNVATGVNPSYAATLPSLLPGFHALYSYAADGQQGTSTQSGSPVTGATAAYGFIVTPPISTLVAQTINFAPLPYSLAANGSQNQMVPLSATANTPVTFSIQSSAGICSLSGNSVVINGAGPCTILATAAPSAVYQVAFAEQTIHVGQAQTLTFPPIPPQTAGTSITLSATASSGLNVVFVTTTSTICSVTASSVSTATFITAGTCNIVASVPASTYYDYIPVTASQNITVLPAAVTPPNVTSFVTSQSPGAVRNNYSGYVGFQFTPTQAISVTGLGRYVAAGNTRLHNVLLLQQTASAPSLIAQASIPLAGATSGQYEYGQLQAAVSLSPNTTYYLVSQEVYGGDTWYDIGPITTAGVANVLAPVYTDAGGHYVSVAGLPGQSYVPVSFLYTSSTSQPPTLGVTITTPATGAAFQAGSQVSISVSTTGNPTTLQLQVDGANVGAAATSSPLILDTTSLSLGQHTVAVSASDGVTAVTSAAITINLTSATTAMNTFITNQTASVLRNNYTGFVGMAIQVGTAPLTVSSLGRFAVTGNAGTHTVKFVQSSGVDVPGGTANLSLTNSSAGQYAYASLPTPVTLQANNTYYLVSQETSGADSWYDLEPVTPTSAAKVLGAVYSDAQGHYVLVSGLPGYCYIPLNFQYQ